MKNASDIKRHLKPYVMYQARRTTINHAFASALGVVDEYDEGRVAEGLALLGLDPLHVQCVYCDQPAETWDHLHGLVRDGRFAGRGHQLGNLVPACKSCNSKKGNGDWRAFAAKRGTSPDRVECIERYERMLDETRDEAVLAREYPDLMTAYVALRESIVEKLREADTIAAEIQHRERQRRKP
jgi:endonuclease I